MLLRPDEAHIWYVQLDAVTAPELIASYHELLDAEEQQRYARFRFERDRKAYLVAHVLLRTMLSQYAPIDPRAWRFKTNAHGRPEVASPKLGQHLRFNLSHTHGLVACGFAIDRPIGVDVETLDRRIDVTAVARRFFASDEIAVLRTLPPEARRRRFIEYWTLKEAYIKARGRGLSLPLNQFSFHFTPDGQPDITIGPDLEDDAKRWRFVQNRPTPKHDLAVAIRREPSETITTVLYETVPLKEYRRR